MSLASLCERDNMSRVAAITFVAHIVITELDVVGKLKPEAGKARRLVPGSTLRSTPRKCRWTRYSPDCGAIV
jgi:hypothetical protein